MLRQPQGPYSLDLTNPMERATANELFEWALREGDAVEITIDRIGTLVNPVKRLV